MLRAWERYLALGLLSIGLAGHGAATVAESLDRRTLLVLGDSLAAGHGVDPQEAFPSHLQRWIDAAGLRYEVVNGGVSGDTTAGGLRRLPWLLRRPVDVLLIELGGNDGLRGLSPEATRSNLVAIIDTTRARQPGVRVVLSGMQMPPNMGPDYVARFRSLFADVARERKCDLVPHLLEGVGGVAEMNQADQIHPTPLGHARVASNVWAVVRPLLSSGGGR